MSYQQNYLSLDPTWKDAFGRPLLRMTFDWQPNEVKASQFLVGKAVDMCQVLNPKSISSDAKKTALITISPNIRVPTPVAVR